MGVKEPRYRLLACDLDGTLIGEETTIHPRVCRAVAQAQARGVQVTLATGRGFPEALPFARTLDVEIPLICYQGGLIKHPLTNELLHRATLERSLVLQVIELARARDWHLVVYLDAAIYVQELRHPRRFYYDMLGVTLHQVEDLARTVSQHDCDPAKFLVVADKAASDRIQAELSARFAPNGGNTGGPITVVRSHDLFVEGNPRGVNKGDALRRLAGHLDVPQAQVMAIGDQGNDVAMLEWAGLGVAMGSGSEAARAVADWVAPSLAEHGAAVAIENFVL